MSEQSKSSHAPIEFLKAISSSQIQQRHTIAGFEWLCGTRFPATNKVFAKVLMQLYDAEVVEEEVFLCKGRSLSRL